MSADTRQAPGERDSAAVQLGATLRRIRAQQGMSLADVQARSGGVWKAVVVGAYERGDRAVTLSRLARLADFYGVPLADLLPDPRGTEDDDDAQRVTIDLTRLEGDDPQLQAVGRFVDHVRSLRGDHNGRVLTLRGGDLTTIALAIGADGESMRRRLDERGALLSFQHR